MKKSSRETPSVMLRNKHLSPSAVAARSARKPGDPVRGDLTETYDEDAETSSTRPASSAPTSATNRLSTIGPALRARVASTAALFSRVRSGSGGKTTSQAKQPTLECSPSMHNRIRSGTTNELVPGMSTRINSLSSQGMFVSDDGSAALSHASTSPKNFYKACYNSDDVINMDRGSFGHTRNGTNFGSVFDGVTAGGKINAYAAQAFSDCTYRFLMDNAAKFEQGSGVNDQLAKDLFSAAIDPSSNPGTVSDGQYEAEGGSATGLFVMFQDTGKRDYVIANGASIGDTAAIVCYNRRCESHIISTGGYRRSASARDTGGQLIMCIGIDGEIWSFSAPVGRSDLVILCTDGLLDNVRSEEIPVLLPMIIRLDVFDAEAPVGCPTTCADKAHLPTMSDVLMYAGKTRELVENMELPSPEIAARRLHNYVQWVTKGLMDLENAYYAHELKARKLHETKGDIKRQSQLQGDYTEENIHRMAGLDGQLFDLNQEKMKMISDRKGTYAGKTDDVIIVVMRPKHQYKSI
eukprot:m.662151 g.662151  ORF g.662151 m.662151 type:complete len:522 (+) comp22738_c0_seq22:564-2129(+)